MTDEEQEEYTETSRGTYWGVFPEEGGRPFALFGRKEDAETWSKLPSTRQDYGTPDFHPILRAMVEVTYWNGPEDEEPESLA